MTGMTEIVVQGQLDKRWFASYDNLHVTHSPSNTILTGFVKDEAYLHGILLLFRDLNITLISINPIENIKTK